MGSNLARIERKGLYRNDPLNKQIHSKLLADPKIRKGKKLDMSKATQESRTDEIAQRINDSHSLRQMLPDLDLAKHIIVSSILSPHDLQTAELNFFVEGGFENHPAYPEMLKVIDQHFRKDYRLNDELSTILETALFDEGANVRAVLPESEIDRIINSNVAISKESVSSQFNNDFSAKKHIGILGDSYKKGAENQSSKVVSLESYFDFGRGEKPPVANKTISDKLNLEVTDNPAVLRTGLLTNRLRSQSIVSRFGNNKLRSSMERYQRGVDEKGKATKEKKKDKKDKVDLPRRIYDAENLVTLTDPGMVNVDKDDMATVIKLPMESVIPVHTPGDPSNHVGYWVVLERGHPVRKRDNAYHYQRMGNQLKSSNQVSAAIQSTAREWFGVDDFKSDKPLDEHIQAYESIIETELVARLENGLYKDGVEMSMRGEVYRMMLARALDQKQTTLLFLPAEFVSYIAFDYDDNGIGRSLIENTKIIGGIRAMMLFSTTMNQTKNAIGRTLLEIEYDGTEVDPEGVREFVVKSFLDSRSPYFPVGDPNPINIMDYLRRAGVEVKTTGHPDIPDTKVNAESFNTSLTEASPELEESLKRRHYLGLGVSPDLMDQAENLDLATSIVRRDLLLSKRVLKWQLSLCSQLVRHIRVYAIYSGGLLDALTEAVSSARKGEPEEFEDMDDQELVSEFLYGLNASLPRPDGTTMENQRDAMDTQKTIVESAVDNYLSSDMFSGDDAKELEYLVPNIRQQLVSMFMRRWMRKNNILPELDDLLTFEDGAEKPQVVEELKTHTTAILRTLSDYAIEMDEKGYAREQKRQKLEEKRRLREEEEEERKRQEEDARRQEEEGGAEEEEEVTGDEELPEEEGGEEETPPEEEGGDTPPDEESGTEEEDDFGF